MALLITMLTLETFECSKAIIRHRLSRWWIRWRMVLSLSIKSMNNSLSDDKSISSNQFDFSTLPTVISSSSATTTTCLRFENFSRNCPEIMFKSHFDEVIILQLFITLVSTPIHINLRFCSLWLSEQAKLLAISKTNSHSAMWNPFSQHTLFNAYRSV